MIQNNNHLRTSLFVAGCLLIVFAILRSYQRGSVSTMLLILYLAGIIILFLHQLLRFTAFKEEVHESHHQQRRKK